MPSFCGKINLALLQCGRVFYTTCIIYNTHYSCWPPIRRADGTGKKFSFQLIFPAPIVIRSQIFVQWSFASQSVSMLKTNAIKFSSFLKLVRYFYYSSCSLVTLFCAILYYAIFIVLIIPLTIWCVLYTFRFVGVLLCQRNCFNDTGKHLFKCLYFLLLYFRSDSQHCVRKYVQYTLPLA